MTRNSTTMSNKYDMVGPWYWQLADISLKSELFASCCVGTSAAATVTCRTVRVIAMAWTRKLVAFTHELVRRNVPYNKNMAHVLRNSLTAMI